MMLNDSWFNGLPAAITICDPEGIILAMNDRSAQAFEPDGGKQLIGKSLFDCHSSSSQVKLAEMLKNQTINCYSVEKNGVKKLIYQAPWYNEGKYAGLVEFIIELPSNIPHIIRTEL